MVSNHDEPLVSIITPCYNGEQHVGRLLDSVLEQSYSNIEIIVVNDGSVDRTEEIVMEYQKLFCDQGMAFLYLHQENRGQAAALNQGLKVFRGEYLSWVDADDYLTKDSIRKKVEFLERSNDYQMVRSNGVFINERTSKPTRRISISKERVKENIFEDILMERTYCSCGCYMIRRQAFLDAYPEKEIYVSKEGQNWQMLLPVSSRSRCGYIDEDLYCIVERTTSHSRKKRSKKLMMARVSGLEEILINTLPRCNCDYESTVAVIRKKYTKTRLRYAAYYKDEQLMMQEYTCMKANEWLDYRSRLDYLRGKSRVVNFVMQVVEFPVRVINKLRRFR